MIFKPKRVAILGVNGMLGSSLFRVLSENEGLTIYGFCRNVASTSWFAEHKREFLFADLDILNDRYLMERFETLQIDSVINCVGIIKQLPHSRDYIESLSVNSLLPHRLAKICAALGIRLIHFSTDCVFDGVDGGYTEADVPNATDLYGRSKLLGEVTYGKSITLRTSIIGHELGSCNSLVDWFLSQKSQVRGFRRAIFSGLPTVEVSRVIEKYVLPNEQLNGLYHLSVAPIDKFSLLKMISEVYGFNVELEADDSVSVDRSLVSSKFQIQSGYAPPSWVDLIKSMRLDAELHGLVNLN